MDDMVSYHYWKVKFVAAGCPDNQLDQLIADVLDIVAGCYQQLQIKSVYPNLLQIILAHQHIQTPIEIRRIPTGPDVVQAAEKIALKLNRGRRHSGGRHRDLPPTLVHMWNRNPEQPALNKDYFKKYRIAD